MYTIQGFNYIPSTPGKVVQRIKGNRRPKNAIKGGRGSFVVTDRAQALITLVDETGKKTEIDASGVMRVVVHRDDEKLNEDYAKKIYNQLDGKTTEYNYIDEKMVEEAWDIVKNQ